jgi:hypothetical protein
MASATSPTSVATKLASLSPTRPAWPLRFRRVDEEEFQAPVQAGIPALIELGRLLQATERILI